MRIRLVLALAMVALLIAAYAYSDDLLKVRNATEAIDASLSYLSEHYAQNALNAGIKWQEKTIFSGGPVDLATTSKQFTSDTWSVEVSQGLAPLRNIVYQVTVFSPKRGWYWKGSVKADGSVKEQSAFKQLSEEEKQKTAEEFLRRSRIPSPQGGYGH